MSARRIATVALVCAIGLPAPWVLAQTAAPGPVQAPSANLMSLSASATQEVTMDTLSVTLAVVREGADAAQVQAQLRQA